MQAFPRVMFGDAPLKTVGMASIEFAGGCFTFEDVGIIHKDKKDGPRSSAIRGSETNVASALLRSQKRSYGGHHPPPGTFVPGGGW